MSVSLVSDAQVPHRGHPAPGRPQRRGRDGAGAPSARLDRVHESGHSEGSDLPRRDNVTFNELIMAGPVVPDLSGHRRDQTWRRSPGPVVVARRSRSGWDRPWVLAAAALVVAVVALPVKIGASRIENAAKKREERGAALTATALDGEQRRVREYLGTMKARETCHRSHHGRRPRRQFLGIRSPL